MGQFSACWEKIEEGFLDQVDGICANLAGLEHNYQLG